MLKLEDIKSGAEIRGIQGDDIVKVAHIDPVGSDAVTVIYKDAQAIWASK
ncbi:hypothetical protein NCG89_02985 [Spongiibacter taiwanensis]|nr:hypothetical protein [Spongiibacter taiwanensis]USA43760.1 hypothetical protein NCG89_02985 [Spongiibacter taiwanensis]